MNQAMFTPFLLVLTLSLFITMDTGDRPRVTHHPSEEFGMSMIMQY